MMYVNVVVGVDGRSGGRDAVALAEALAPMDIRLCLAHVRVVSRAPPRRSSGTSGEHDRSLELLELERRSCDPEAETVSIAATSVGAGLHDVAEGRGADLLVVGGAHRSAVGRVLAGDNARSVLHQAPCAVAVAPAGYADGSRPLGTIAAAYDGSDESEVAAAHAALLAAGLRAKLLVRNVVELHVYGGVGWTSAPVLIENPANAVAAARERLGDLHGGELDVIVGPIREELAALSERVDVLVCGSHHHGAAKRVVRGSISDYLARHSACPLLVTPATDEKLVAAWYQLRDAAGV